jgi:hypothetical protein
VELTPEPTAITLAGNLFMVSTSSLSDINTYEVRVIATLPND